MSVSNPLGTLRREHEHARRAVTAVGGCALLLSLVLGCASSPTGQPEHRADVERTPTVDPTHRARRLRFGRPSADYVGMIRLSADYRATEWVGRKVDWDQYPPADWRLVAALVTGPGATERPAVWLVGRDASDNVEIAVYSVNEWAELSSEHPWPDYGEDFDVLREEIRDVYEGLRWRQRMPLETESSAPPHRPPLTPSSRARTPRSG